MAGAVGATWCPRGEKQPRVAKLGCAAACGLGAPASVGWAPKAPHGVRSRPASRNCTAGGSALLALVFPYKS